MVDASGAHSKGGEWLQQLDLGVPEDEVVEGYSGYSSRWFTHGKRSRVAVRVVVESALSPDRYARAAVFHRLLPDREPALAAELYRREQVISAAGRGGFHQRRWSGSRSRSCTRWCGAWNRSLQCIPVARRGTDGAITSAGGHRSAGLSRSPTRPARSIHDLARA